MLAAGDTFRAAAIEQLEIWGDRNNVPVIAQAAGADPAAVIFDAMQAAQARGTDVLIADTAGRLHTQSNLMDELRKVRRVLGAARSGRTARGAAGARRGPGSERARPGAQFHEALGVTGIVLTKLDGTGEGRHRARDRRPTANPDPVHRRRRERAGLRRVRRGHVRRRGARARARSARPHDPASTTSSSAIRTDARRSPISRCDIGRGEMVFLTGHSGAGKSTLLKLIALIERPTRGNAARQRPEHRPLVPRSKIPAFRRQIGVVFQDHKLLMDRPVYDNVALPLVIAGVPEKRSASACGRRSTRWDCSVASSNRPIELSTGEQQRVGIARAVISKPPLLIADEPTGNLDPELAVEIMKLFKRFNDVGVTVLIASHDVHLIERFGVRRVMIEGGRVAGRRSGAETLRRCRRTDVQAVVRAARCRPWSARWAGSGSSLSPRCSRSSSSASRSRFRPVCTCWCRTCARRAAAGARTRRVDVHEADGERSRTRGGSRPSFVSDGTSTR